MPGVGPSCPREPWTTQLCSQGRPGRERAGHRPSGFPGDPAGGAAPPPCSAAVAPSRPLGPGKSGAREGPPRNSESAPHPQPAPTHPPVSAPESTQSSSSPAPSLRSMVRSPPRSARGHRRDLGRAPSGPPSTVQPELAGLAASVSTPRLGETTPASAAVHCAAPSPGHTGPGTGGHPPRPSPLGRVSVCALGFVSAQEGVCSGCEDVRAVCACAPGYVHAQEGVCTEWERVRADVHTCASMCELACCAPVCGVRA